MTNYKIPSIYKRGLASVIDAFIPAIIGFLIIYVACLFLGINFKSNETIFLGLIINGILLIIYNVYFLNIWSTTPGKKLLNLKVITFKGKLDLQKIYRRTLFLYMPSFLFSALNFNWLTNIWAIIIVFAVVNDNQKRGLHDKFAGTIVVSTK